MDTATPFKSFLCRVRITTRICLLLLLYAGCHGCTPPETLTELGPESAGRINGIVVTDDAGDMLVASPGGGIWKSHNNGNPPTADKWGNWTEPRGHGLGDFNVNHLEWDALETSPGTSSRLWAVTYTGLYDSTDFGDTWAARVGTGGRPGSLLPQDRGSSFIDPIPFAQLKHSATQRSVFFSHGCKGLFYSFDGVTFHQHFPFPGGESNDLNCIYTIAANPSSKIVYFASAFSEANEYSYVYAMDTAWPASLPASGWSPGWSRISSFRFPYKEIIAALTATAGNSVTAIIKVRNQSTAYRYDGKSWTVLGSVPAPAYTPRPLVYAGGDLFLGDNLPRFSKDGGATWSIFKSPFLHVDARSLFPLSKRSTIWVGADGDYTRPVVPLGSSQDAIMQCTWTPGKLPSGCQRVETHNVGMYTVQLYDGVKIPGSDRLLASAQDSSTVCSDDGGTTWNDGGFGGTEPYSMVLGMNGSSGKLYLLSPDGFYRSDNAVTASACSAITMTVNTGVAGPVGIWTSHAMAVDPKNWETLVIAGGCELFYSENGGRSFTSIQMPEGCSIASMSVHLSSNGPGKKPAIYVGTAGSGAYKLTWNGRSWDPPVAFGLNSNAPRYINAITQSTASAGSWWLATSDGLYRSTDNGSSWARKHGGNNYVVSEVEVDPHCPGRVYAGFGFSGPYMQHRGGVDVSSDNGENWTSLTSGTRLHQTPITSISVDTKDAKQVYVTSYGRGMWKKFWGKSLPVCK